ncbi:hypothetical protein Sango_2677400 [Sesamum angolense]|uniref:Uncharacterized protein n=1 Tax=Sesamum angolense TaxID=2727404 RepID=A0AAE2BHD6_9LAMI|nr:hypothetical protein Sango_2677400 [Sesamum angolense]
MSSYADEDQEQRKTSSVEESDSMTIEFLRARLLSERSVSKSARQRADDLAKRVEELEEQLKFVSLQREKAEKATANVLAILEDRGISDVSEEFDSYSEQDESPHDFKARNGSLMIKEPSMHTELRKNEVEAAYSSSEIESSPSTELQKDGAEKPTCSSDVNSFDGEPVGPRGSSGYANGKNPLESPIFGSNSEPQKVYEHSFTGHERNEDMESALQHQAQLIGRYEEEEKAQREWEEKFRENNSGTQDIFFRHLIEAGQTPHQHRNL